MGADSSRGFLSDCTKIKGEEKAETLVPDKRQNQNKHNAVTVTASSRGYLSDGTAINDEIKVRLLFRTNG